MTHKPLVVHRLARDEASAAFKWYRQRSSDAAAKFTVALTRAFQEIERDASCFPEYLASTRRCRLRKFPYLVVFREMPDYWLIVAIAHGHRRPGYWRQRR